MNLTAYRDGRVAPRVQVNTWKCDHQLRVYVHLWAFGWSVSWTNVGVR